MRNLILLIALFYIGFAKAQCGYFGQKNLVVIGIQSYNGVELVDYSKPNEKLRYSLSYFRTLENSVSIGLSAGRRIGLVEGEGYIDGGNVFPFSLKYKETDANLHFRYFMKSYGSASPLGFYFQLNFGRVKRNYADVEMTENIEEIRMEVANYTANDLVYKSFSITSGVTKAIGKKIAIDGGLTLGINTTNTLSPYPPYGFDASTDIWENESRLFDIPFVKLNLGVGYFF